MDYGTVIKVSRDYVYVAVDDELIHKMGIRGTFVKIPTKKGRTLIGIVSNISLLDELYAQSKGRISIIEGYEGIAVHRNEIFVSLLGTISDGHINRRIDAIPSPGDKVLLVKKDELSRFFAKGEIKIGHLTTAEDVDVKVRVNDLATKHLAILAMTGSGKSNTLAVLLVEILHKFRNPRVLLIDTHSEYVVLGSNKSPVKDRVTIYAPTGKFKEVLMREGYRVEPLEIPYWLLTVDEWFSLLSIMPNASRQRREFRAALRQVKSPHKINDPVYFDIDELNRVISNDDVKEKLEDVMDSEEFDFIFNPERSISIINQTTDATRATIEIFKLVAKPIISGGLKILSLGGLSADVQNAVVSMMLRTLFRIAVESKLAGLPLPSLVAVEEAHIYAPEKSYATAKSILEKIAKEGRKFGIGLIIVSQRPREISQTVLAQCGNLIALRTVNPLDQRHIQESLEDITSALVSNLPGLGIGEAIVSGPFVPVPCVVKIEHFEKLSEELFNRKIQLGGKDIDFNLSWNEEIKEEELDVIFSRLYELGATKERKKRTSPTGALDIFITG